MREVARYVVRAAMSWRDEPWPLMPWRSMPGAYHATVLVTAIVEIIVIAAFTVIQAPSLAISPPVALAALLVTCALCGRSFRDSMDTADDTEAWIAVALVLGGHPLEGVICVIAGRAIRIARKPLPAHLAAANLLNGIAVPVLLQLVLARAPLIGSTWSVAWTVQVAVTITVLHVVAALPVVASLVAGGYVPRDQVIRDFSSDLRVRVAGNVPLTLLVGNAIAGGGWGAVLALAAIPLALYAIVVRTDALVAARDEADHDPMTGLLNRRAFDRQIAAAAPAATGRRRWLLVCDLDRFKNVNDTLGHEAGDRAIVEVARRMRSLVQPPGLVARFGGDEFVISVEADRDEVERIAHSVKTGIDQSIGFLGVSISIGIHPYIDGEDERLAHGRADIAMYIAKRSGGTGVCFSEDAALERDALVGRDGSSGEHGVLCEERAHPDTGVERDYWESVAAACKSEGDLDGQARALYQVYWLCDDPSSNEALHRTAAIGDGRPGWASRARAAINAREGRFEDAIRADLEAVRQAGERGDRILEILALLGAAHAQVRGGQIATAIAYAQRALRIASVHRSHERVFHAHRKVIEYLSLDGRLDEALVETMQLERFALSSGRPMWSGLARALRASALLESGDLHSARRSIEAQDAAGAALPGADGGLIVAAALLDLGDRDAAREWLDAVRDAPHPSARGDLEWLDDRVRDDDVVDAERCMKLAARSSHPARALLLLLRRTVAWGADERARDIAEAISRAALPCAFDRCAVTEARSIAVASAGGSLAPLQAAADEWLERGHRFESLRCRTMACLLAARAAHVPAWLDAAIARAETECRSMGAMVELDVLAAAHRAIHRDGAYGVRAGEGALAVLSRPLFASLLEHSTRISLAGGEPIARPSEFDSHLYLVEKGVVLTHRDALGAEMTTAVFGPGEVLGGERALGGTEPGSTRASCLVPSVVHRISVERLRSLAASDAELGRELSRLAGDRLDRARQRVEQLSHWSSLQRLAGLLLDLDDRFGTDALDGSRTILCPLSQQQLAELIGTSRKSLVRALGLLRAQGIVATRRRRIAVLDRKRLEHRHGETRRAA